MAYEVTPENCHSQTLIAHSDTADHADNCSGLQGFLVLHSFDNGTRPGFRTILKYLSTDYGEKARLEFCAYPAPKPLSSIVELYIYFPCIRFPLATYTPTISAPKATHEQNLSKFAYSCFEAQSRSAKADRQFPVSCIHCMLKKGNYTQRVGAGSP
ncbi:alpha-tubulin, partial [Ceratobasidium sp. 370]